MRLLHSARLSLQKLANINFEFFVYKKNLKNCVSVGPDPNLSMNWIRIKIINICDFRNLKKNSKTK